jgi:hypothetical protein
MTKTAFTAVTLLAVVLLGATLASAKVSLFGSYITSCDAWSTNVTFTNFAEQDCQGPSTSFATQLNQCATEHPPNISATYSWNSKCNATNMWYNNFANTKCAGKSVLTRWYTTHRCFNCLTKDCKNQ